MGGWGSRVLNLWKCENTRFLRNFCGRYFRYVTGKSRYFRYVSPKPLRWVGGVRCLRLFPKKIDFFLDAFPYWFSPKSWNSMEECILHYRKTLYSMSVDVCWQSMQEDDDWRQWLCCTLADPSLFLHTIRKSRKPQLGRSVIALLQWYKATGHMYHSGRWQWSLVPKGIFHIFAHKLQKPLRKYCC